MPGILSNTALIRTYEHYNKISSLAGDQKDRSVLQFINGLQDMGLWDKIICWPLKSTQNVGLGTLAYGIGGLSKTENYTYDLLDGTLVNNASWSLSGITSKSCTSGYIKISNGAGLLSADDVISGSAFTSTFALTGSSSYYHYWIYGNQIGETDNIEYGGGFKEGVEAGLINNMRSAELSGSFGTSQTSNGTFQFLINSSVAELTGNTKTFLNGEVKTIDTIPLYYYLENENSSLSSINLENELPILLEEKPQPLDKLLVMCQDEITMLLQQDSSTLYVDSQFHDNSYQIGRSVVPSGAEWVWEQSQSCTSWDSTKSIGINPITWDSDPYTGITSFHFIIKDTVLTEDQIKFIYELYTNTIDKPFTPTIPASGFFLIPQGTSHFYPYTWIVDQQNREHVLVNPV